MKDTVLMLPTDNRPVTYLFPQLIVQLANLEVLTPPRELMGSLFAPSNLGELTQWVQESVSNISSGAVLLCLDSLLYGGLIPSRRSEDTLEQILERAEIVQDLKKRTHGKVRIYAQSSIMRISDNYDNSEEKLYWSQYGREIFKWSQLLHKKELGILESQTQLSQVESSIPKDIRQDYLATRLRNFTVNQKIIDYVKAGYLDFLIFSQDDSGHFGLNVSEKNQLVRLSKDQGLPNVLAYPGADEMLMTLIAHYLNSKLSSLPKVTLQYSGGAKGEKISSNYEGQNIGESMRCQANAQALEIIDAGITAENIDFHIIVHTGENKQGDHMWLPGLPDTRTIESEAAVNKAIELIEQANAPIVLCDLVYSNGADPLLIERLLARPELFKKIWSYAGWNTTGNAVGSALAVGSACFYAQSGDPGLNDEMRKKMLFVRLMDDWAYQTQVRKEITVDKTLPQQEVTLSLLMDTCAAKLARALGFKPGSIEYKLPWHRTFEVEICLDWQLAPSFL